MRALPLFLFLLPCLSPGSNHIPAQRVDTPPEIDGHLDFHSEWPVAPSGEGSFDAETGQAGPEGLRFWIAYDDRYVYVAAKLADSQPQSIRASEYRTNASLSGDDTFQLSIDPFGTLNEFNAFEINPRGATNIRIAGGRAPKREWLGDIQAAAKVTEEGWQLEARIPWSIMRLPPAGKRDIRLLASRRLMRTQRSYNVWNVANGRILDAGRWVGVDLPKQNGRRTLKLLPYAFGGQAEREDAIFDAGLDLKTSLTDQIELVGSINPDFRNVENQVLSLDFSYFERLAGESRPFFLEGAQFFNTSMDAPIFASQRIREFDLGLKTFGKIGDRTSIALLDTLTLGEDNATVARVQHQLGPRTSVTAALANLSRTGLDNLATFFSASHGFGPAYWFGQFSSTHDTFEGAGRRINTGAGYENRGFSLSGEYVEIGREFRPRLGFAPERDLRGYRLRANYESPTDRFGLMEYEFGIGGFDYERTDGSPYRSGMSASGSLTFQDRTDLDFGVRLDRFRGFDDRLFWVSLEKPRGDPRRSWEIDFQTGNIQGRDFRLFGPSFNYRPIERLQLNLSYQKVWHFEERELAILGGTLDLFNDMSISGRAVHRDGNTNAYLAFRRSGNRGAEYYVILGDPNAPTSRASLVIKAVLPFELRL